MYTLIITDLRERAIADRAVIIALICRGVEGLELPDPDAEQAKFDKWLISVDRTEARPQNTARIELERALGLRT